MKKIWNYFFLVLLFSCQKDKKSDHIFFGGQIVNPSSSYVTLYKDNQRIDSLELDKTFKFYKKYDSLDLGIYKIEHIPEYNSVFLEKGKEFGKFFLGSTVILCFPNKKINWDKGKNIGEALDFYKFPKNKIHDIYHHVGICLLYTSPSPRD